MLISGKISYTDALSSQPLYTLGSNKHYELMYSLGVSLLYAGQASKAFDCFTEAAQRFHNHPKLWLRMAECCIFCYKQVNLIFDRVSLIYICEQEISQFVSIMNLLFTLNV